MEWKSFWNEFPVKFGETDFLKQVEKTVGGKPISPVQFETIISDIHKTLETQMDDIVLDLCCGNGVITAIMSKACKFIVGVDYSEPLIKIAQKYNKPENASYFQMSVLDLNANNLLNKSFTKIYMYEALQHFNEDGFPKILALINEISSPSSIIFIGSIPNIDKLWDFYDTDERRKDYLERKSKNQEAIGTWWNQKYIVDTCLQNGFECEILSQSQVLHTAHYRFDIRLTKRSI